MEIGDLGVSSLPVHKHVWEDKGPKPENAIIQRLQVEEIVAQDLILMQNPAIQISRVKAQRYATPP
jgi:hypothetical protein